MTTKKKKIGWWSGSSQAASVLDVNTIGLNTTADGWQVYLAIGDSNMAGSSGQAAITVTTGAGEKWNGSAFVATTNGFSTTAGNSSFFEEFCNRRFANTGYKTAVVNQGLSSTSFGPTSGGDFTLAWAGQARYTTAKNNANAALAAKGLTRLKAVVINLGINDQITNTEQYWNQLLDDIETDFPNVPIIAIQTGTASGYIQSYYNKRKIWINQWKNRTNLFLLGGSVNAAVIGDGLHYSQVGHGEISLMMARLMENSAYTNKFCRCVMSSLFDDLTTTRKNVIDYCVSTLVTSGLYWKLEAWLQFTNTAQKGAQTDLSFLGGITTFANLTFTANQDIVTNAVDSNFGNLFKTPTYNSRASQNDVCAGIRIGTITTTSGTSARVFGAEDANALFKFRKASGIIAYSVNDLTDTQVAEVIEQNQNYVIGRSGTDRFLYKNKVLIHQSSQASTGTPSTLNNSAIGSVISSSGVPAGRIAASFHWFFAGIYSTFDISTMVDVCDYWRVHWND